MVDVHLCETVRVLFCGREIFSIQVSIYKVWENKATSTLPVKNVDTLSQSYEWEGVSKSLTGLVTNTIFDVRKMFMNYVHGKQSL